MKGRDKRKLARVKAEKKKGVVPWKKKMTQPNLDRIVDAVKRTFKDHDPYPSS